MRPWSGPALAALLLLAAAPAQELPFHLPEALPAASPKTASYHLRVELEDDGATLSGELEAVWRNPTEASTSELQWHVYNNAWRDAGSAFLREQRRIGDGAVPRAWGGTEIEEVALLSGPGDPAPLAWAWIPPADAPEDRTVMRVQLPGPVGPGEAVKVRVRFTALLPPAFRRSGTDGRGGYVHAAQWFPKLGVFEAQDGVTAWNCLPYRFLTEFYADYGDYVLELTTPGRYAGKVAATGTQVEAEELAGGRWRARFEAQDVHDFAWTADPDFVVVERVFDPAEWRDEAEEQRVAAALGRSVEAVRPRAVRMLLYRQPEHEAAEPRYLDATAQALYFFQLWFGPYPYETISIIDPANDARATGGMEYPRLITGGTRRGTHSRTLSPEGVTVHEFGHQYWYGLVGNDEFHHAWMDEGFNTWATNRVLRRGWPAPLATYRVLGRERAGRAPARAPRFGAGDPRALLSLERAELPDLGFLPAFGAELRRSTSVERWLQELPPVGYWPEVEVDRVRSQRKVVGEDWSDALSRATYELAEGTMRRVNAYYRPALVLETLARLMGETRWTRVMRAYSERYRFAHPRPEDFYAVLEEFGRGARLGEVELDWGDLWHQAYAENSVLDYGVKRLVNLPVEGGDGEPTWDVVLELRRYGGFRVPVEVRVVWEDGSSEEMVWDGSEPWTRYQWSGQGRRAVSAEVDPARRLLLDRDWLNNSLLAEPDEGRAWNAGLRAWIWAQQVLHHAGGQG